MAGAGKKNIVKLTDIERADLEEKLHRGRILASVRKRALALYALDKNATHKEASRRSGLSISAVKRLAFRYVQFGFETTIYGAEKRKCQSPYTVEDEAELVALACSDPPEGRKCWTNILLAEELSKRIGKPIKKTKVNILLKKRDVNLGNIKCGVSAK